MKIGVSGHQSIGSHDVESWVKAQLRFALGKYDQFTGVSSLAVGSDQMFARIVVDQKQALEAIIPCEHYELSFKGQASLRVYERLLSKARTRHTMAFDCPSEHAFYAAGCRIVDSVSLMLFIWNGLPAKGLGGTADIVKYAVDVGRNYIHINPEAKTLRQVFL